MANKQPTVNTGGKAGQILDHLLCASDANVRHDDARALLALVADLTWERDQAVLAYKGMAEQQRRRIEADAALVGCAQMPVDARNPAVSPAEPIDALEVAHLKAENARLRAEVANRQAVYAKWLAPQERIEQLEAEVAQEVSRADRAEMLHNHAPTGKQPGPHPACGCDYCTLEAEVARLTPQPMTEEDWEIGGRIVAKGEDGSILLDTRGGQRKRIWPETERTTALEVEVAQVKYELNLTQDALSLRDSDVERWYSLARKLAEALKVTEYGRVVGSNDKIRCLWCGWLYRDNPDERQHAPDCQRQAALALARAQGIEP